MDRRLPPSPAKDPILQHALRFVCSPFGFVEDAVRECGDVYRFELPGVDDTITLVHPDQFRRVLVTDVESFGKTEDFRRAFGEGVLSVEGEQWRRQRRILQPLFDRERIGGYADVMVECTERRLERWSAGESLKMEPEMKALTLEILLATLFGRELRPGEGSELREAAEGLNDWFAPTSWILPAWVPTPARRRFRRSVARLRREVRELLAEGGTDASDTLDLLSRLRKAREPEDDRRLTRREIEDQLITMVFAGHETTASTLSFAWYLLATHPEAEARFHAELDSVLGGRPPTREDLPELEYTRRVLEETLRLYPPVHTIPRLTLTDVEIDGYDVPASREVHLSVIHAHRDDRFYDDPLQFRPERWVDGFEEELHDFAYAPFGGGRRTCIGREFALLEAQVVLATIGQRYAFDWEGGAELGLNPRVTIRSENGIPLRIRAR
ncbi:cytochrome P450 [Halobium palmae]|uniref:Cytochrome P450 n=1 Tax=Halobium palmae TaxID=1776492 RepID=A0ABD5RXW3_9EURY